jgi:excisionase family DNA binding protein
MDTAGPPKKGMISINEAARRCRVSRRTVVNWIDRDYLRAEKAPNGHNVWLNAEAVATFDRERRENGLHKLGRPRAEDKIDPALALRMGDRNPGARA